MEPASDSSAAAPATPAAPAAPATALPVVYVYDTLQQKKVALEPIVPGEIRMYVCGPTVYNLFHIGNARPLVAFDVVARHLRGRGYRVTFVRNITDVDDKIINRARECGEDPSAFAERWTAEYHRDYAALGCRPSDVEPRATAHIAEMQAQIAQLIERGVAYATPSGSVYFAVASFPGYGELSHLPREELLAGARKELEADKRDAADFALWKAAKPGEPSWPSPWGPGRPGWHIECSAMAERYLGTRFDLHGGGIDLRFPHHENERAQAQGVHGPSAFARYWMHNGFVGFRWVHNGEVLAEGSKIAKSDERMRMLYHAFVARTCIERHGGEAVRLWLLTTQYRNPITFDVDLPPDAVTDESKLKLPGLEEAEGRLEYAYLTRQRLDDALGTLKSDGDGAVLPEADGWLARLEAALDDDFNTPVALAEWTAALGLINRVLDNKVTPAVAKDVRRRTLFRLAADLAKAGAALGLLERAPADFLAEHRQRRIKARGLDLTRIEALLAERTAARQQKDFTKSDKLRQSLLELGVEVMDSPSGPRWRVRD
jgi:cysteinyl-tRNA synthetase